MRDGKSVGTATFMLFQKPIDDLGFGFLFGEAEGHQLHELITGNLADGGLVDERGIRVVRLQRGHGHLPISR